MATHGETLHGLGLWPSVVKALEKRGISTIAALLLLSPKELKGPGFGISRIHRVRESLAERGLALRGDNLDMIRAGRLSEVWMGDEPPVASPSPGAQAKAIADVAEALKGLPMRRRKSTSIHHIHDAFSEGMMPLTTTWMCRDWRGLRGVMSYLIARLVVVMIDFTDDEPVEPQPA